MSNFQKKVLYILYILVITVIFLYILFPSEAAKKYIIYNIMKSNPDIKITISDVKPIFPPGLRLNSVFFYNIGDLLFGTEQIKVRPSLLSLFKPVITFNYNGSGYKGVFDGKVDVRGRFPNTQFIVDFNMNHIQLKDIPVLHNLSDYKISGFLFGKTRYFSDKGPTGTLEANLRVAECKIELITSVFNIESLLFKNVEGEIDVIMPKVIIKKGSLKGEQVDGDVKGELTIIFPMGKSVLNLTGTVNPHPSFIKNLGKVYPIDMFLSKNSGKGGLSFKIDGTFDKPNFSLK